VLGAGIDYQFGVAVVNGRVGGNEKIAAEVGGGKHGSSHRIAKFTPQKAAANTGAATVVAQVRRQRGKLALLRHIRHLHGGNEGVMRRICETARCRCIANLAEYALIMS
jgi:hypothetical protein